MEGGMLGTVERIGRNGVVVSFRLETTMELLWSAAMDFIPRVDEFVGKIPDGAEEVAQWYKVEEVRYEFQYENVEVEIPKEPPVVPELAQHAYVGPYVIVSVVV